MFSHTAPTRQPPAGGPGSTAHLDELLQELRRGEREGFLRYFQLFRSPVYDFALRLLGDEALAVAATTEAFIVGFRQVILDEANADLRIVTWRCALDACSGPAGAPASTATRTDAPRAHVAPRAHRLREPDGPGRRFEAALATLDLRGRAALLLHDAHGLGVAKIAAVFGIGEAAAGTLLFRAREQFRQTFDERSMEVRGGSCRLAERAAAGAVGLGLDANEIQRLRRHADYCRPCRAAMKNWAAGPVGLAVFLEAARLPRALSTPVFRGATDSVSLPVVAGVGASLLGRSFGRVGRALRSRTAAYVIAAACLALAAGVAAREDGVRQFILVQSAGPSIRLVTQPPAEKRAPKDRAATPASRASSGSASTVSLVTGEQPLAETSGSTAQPSAGSDASAGRRAGGSTASSESESPPRSAESASSPTERAEAAGVVGKTAAEGRRHATKHGNHHHGRSHGRSHGRAREAGHGRAKAAAPGHARTAVHGHARSAAHGHARTKAAAHGHARSAAPGHARTAVHGHARSAAPGHARTAVHGHAHSAAHRHAWAGHARSAGAGRAVHAGGHHASNGHASRSHGSSHGSKKHR